MTGNNYRTLQQLREDDPVLRPLQPFLKRKKMFDTRISLCAGARSKKIFAPKTYSRLGLRKLNAQQ